MDTLSKRLLLLLFLLLSSCDSSQNGPAPKPRTGPADASPELRTFLDAYDELQVGMSEEEVDALLKAYPQSLKKNPDPDLVAALLRQYYGKFRSDIDCSNCYIKTYMMSTQIIEGDYYITVVFDNAHLSLSKDVSVAIR